LFALKDLDRARFPTHKFLRELRFLLSLQHPNIVTCYALEHTRTGRYLVMDYCEGGTLRSLVEDEVRLHPLQSLKLVAAVLEGLAHAHSKSIIHCDIKPENILLNLQPTGWMARISDFGISRLIQEISNDGEGNTGSPAYMAPERFYGQYSHSSDLYAVGILLFELLVGSRPFSGVPAELMSAHLNQPVRIPDSVPASLRTVILKALQKLQARRFDSATKMLYALRQAALMEGWQLDSKQVNLPLIQSTIEWTVQPFCAQRCEALGADLQEKVGCLSVISALAPLEHRNELGTIEEDRAGTVDDCLNGGALAEWVYWVSGCQVGCRIYSDSIFSAATVQPLWRSRLITLSEPVQELIVCPQAAWGITSRSIFQFMPGLLFAQQTVDHDRDDLSSLPKPLVQFDGSFLAAIEAKGRWLVTAGGESGSEDAQLRIWRLPKAEPLCPPIVCPIPNLFRLLALDACHIAVWFRGVGGASGAELRSDGMKSGTVAGQDRESSDVGTVVKILTRRGKWIGSLQLPISLQQVESSHQPYRVIATELNIPQSCVFIDLKPLKIKRVGIEITPTLMVSTVWGYILADEQGQIVLLDQYGQQFGRIAGPSHPSAIAAFGSSGLLISTWDNHNASLHVIDLKEAGVDFLF
jgi:serine/threonine-protein kinase